jgi:hypothetical protein
LLLEDEVLPPQHAWKLFGIMPPRSLSQTEIARLDLDPTIDPEQMSEPARVVRNRYLEYRHHIGTYRTNGTVEHLITSVHALHDAANAGSWVTATSRSELSDLQASQFALYQQAFELCDEASGILEQPDFMELADEHLWTLENLQSDILIQLKHLHAMVTAGRRGSGNANGAPPAGMLPAAQSHGGMAAAAPATNALHLTPATSRVAAISTNTISALPLFRTR